MTVYKIINGVLKGWQKKPTGYTLKENEVIGGDFLKPALVNGEIVESWTQADQDKLDELAEEQTVAELLEKFENDGQRYFNEFRVYIKRQFDLGNITQNQYKGIRVTLGPALEPLKTGDWDIAQDNIDAITPPTNAKMLALYNKVKDKIDTYLLNNV